MDKEKIIKFHTQNNNGYVCHNFLIKTSKKVKNYERLKVLHRTICWTCESNLITSRGRV